MKTRLLLFAFAIVVSLAIHAQTAPPNGMIYQAVARDGSGNLAAKRTIYVQTTVLRGSATGTVMYADEHKVSSNADAMFTVIVGQGTYLSGVYKKLTDIPWDKDKFFFNLKICVAPTIPRFGWTPSYTDMGTTQFWSVPYAMFSGKSGDSLTLTVNGTGRQIKLGNYKPIFFSVADRDSVATNEIQTLSRTGGRLLLSLNGGMVTLPDSSSTNELQTITRTGGRIILNQNGGTIFLPDSSATNELQTISKTGSTVTLSQGGGSFTDDDKQTLSTTGTGSTKTLSISNGNSVQINVNDADSSITNELQTISQSGNTITLSQGGGSVTIIDNDKQQLGMSGKGTITLSNGGFVKLPDSSAWNEIQRLGITLTKGTITLNNGGGSVQLADSSATNELQKISINGGRITLDQNGGTVKLPDSSDNNELQIISKTGSTVTLSQGGGSFTDDDKQTLSITSIGSNKTLSISNGNSVQINVNDDDNSTTNELQKISINGGRITLDQNGGTVKLPDSSDNNELQTISQSGNTITLSQSGGSVTITDNDKQQLGITSSKGTISLSNGGSVQLADSSATNELQTLTKSGNVITLSNGGGSISDRDSQTLSATSSGLNRNIQISNGNSVSLSVADGDTLHWKQNGNNSTYSKGNVGIGTTTPAAKLEVNGAATNTMAFNAGTSSTIDFSQSNLAYSATIATSFTLSNLKDGGAYSLILTGTTNTGSATFSSAGFTFKYMGTSDMTSGKSHIYSFIVAGTNVYVSMATEN